MGPRGHQSICISQKISAEAIPYPPHPAPMTSGQASPHGLGEGGLGVGVQESSPLSLLP